MAKKKAFVRYAANKAVPGSLIVRTKAPKVGIWKEVPYDVCCGGGGCAGLYAIALAGPNNFSTDNIRAIYCDKDLQNIIGQCADPSLAIGTKLYLDDAGTTPVTDGAYQLFTNTLNSQYIVYVVVDGVIVSGGCPV